MSIARGSPTGMAKPSDFVSFIFKDKDYNAIINGVDGNILAITLVPNGQQLKLYFSNGIWLVENRVPAANVTITKNINEPAIIIEGKTDFTGSQLTDLNILALLNDPEFNALCRTNQYLGQLCRNPALQNEIYKNRLLIHMPEAMKYVSASASYKEVYQSIRKIQKTGLFTDIINETWEPFSRDDFNDVPNVDDIKEIIATDDLIALKYLLDSGGDVNLALWNVLSLHSNYISELFTLAAGTKILNWLITSGNWKAYYEEQFGGEFEEITNEIVRAGLSFGSIAYIENLIDIDVYKRQS